MSSFWVLQEDSSYSEVLLVDPGATPGLYERVSVNCQEYDRIRTSDSELDWP
jgi:hypothetical protein